MEDAEWIEPTDEQKAQDMGGGMMGKYDKLPETAAATLERVKLARDEARNYMTQVVVERNAAIARAEAAEAALAQCQAWRQEDADNLNHCIRAKQTLADDRAKLRHALAQLVGVDTFDELRNMEAVMRAALAPAKDKAAAIDAIHALIETHHDTSL